MGCECRYMGDMRNAHEILIENMEGKRSFRRTWLKWKDNIKKVS